MTGHLVNIWDLIADPDMPSDVVQRAFGRARARALGITPEPIPEADLPHLARHAQPDPQTSKENTCTPSSPS
jgi:hypothetical protein